jgi:hypothetical protein
VIALAGQWTHVEGLGALVQRRRVPVRGSRVEDRGSEGRGIEERGSRLTRRVECDGRWSCAETCATEDRGIHSCGIGDRSKVEDDYSRHWSCLEPQLTMLEREKKKGKEIRETRWDLHREERGFRLGKPMCSEGEKLLYIEHLAKRD